MRSDSTTVFENIIRNRDIRAMVRTHNAGLPYISNWEGIDRSNTQYLLDKSIINPWKYNYHVENWENYQHKMIEVKEKYPMLKTPFFKGADAFTLGRVIHYKTYVHRHRPSLFWHEMCHVCQYEKYGVKKFLYIYFVKDFFKSYRKKRFEVEAYTVKTKQDLLKLYPEYKQLIEEGSRILAKYYTN